MIKVYNTFELDDATKNGDYIIVPTKAIIHNYQNSDFYLDIEAPIRYRECFVKDYVVAVDTPRGTEWFRMGNIKMTHSKISCRCWNVFFDTKYRVYQYPDTYGSLSYEEQYFQLYELVYDTYYGNDPDNIPHGRDGLAVMDFSHGDDIPEYWAKFDGATVYDMIMSYVKEFNAYLEIAGNNFGLSLNRVTHDRGITLEYGKNIKELTKEENWDDVVRVMNYKGKESGAYIKTSSLPNADRFYKLMEFQQNIDSANYQSQADYVAALQADLEAKATAYLNEHQNPQVNYTCNAHIDGVVGLGDQIQVIDRTLGIDLMTYVIGFEWNVITEQYERVEFGNYTKSMLNYNRDVLSNISWTQKKIPLIAYPVGSYYTSSNSTNPNYQGLDGFWELQSSSGGLYTWKRTA